MDVKDISWKDQTSKRFNHLLLPKSIRGLIIGKSGCGKTTLLLNLLLRPGWLDYNNLSVFGKSLFQPEYRIIKKAFEEKLPKEAIMRIFDFRDEVIKLDISPSALIENWAKEIINKSDIECKFYETADDVPDPRDLKSTNKNLMIPTLYACSPKTLRILITFTTIMRAVICQKKNLEACVRKHGKTPTVLWL